MGIRTHQRKYHFDNATEIMNLKSICYESRKPYYLRKDYELELPTASRPDGSLSDFTIYQYDGLYKSEDNLIVLEVSRGKVNLKLRKYYASDGMSVPLIFIPLISIWVPRRKRVIPGFIHDALYELMRQGILPRSTRPYADALLYRLCVECGAPRWIASIFYKAVRCFGEKYTQGSQRRKILYAP